jgi:hypothetical protein
MFFMLWNISYNIYGINYICLIYFEQDVENDTSVQGVQKYIPGSNRSRVSIGFLIKMYYHHSLCANPLAQSLRQVKLDWDK